MSDEVEGAEGAARRFAVELERLRLGLIEQGIRPEEWPEPIAVSAWPVTAALQIIGQRAESLADVVAKVRAEVIGKRAAAAAAREVELSDAVPASDERVRLWASRLPLAVALSRQAGEAGLVVLKLFPHRCACEHFEFSFWSPNGQEWADGSGETAGEVREHITRYLDRPERRAWVDQREQRSAKVVRVSQAVRAAIAAGAGPPGDWGPPASDLLSTLEEICERGNHPDDSDRAERAIMDLAALWLSPGEVERIYLAGAADCSLGGSDGADG